MNHKVENHLIAKYENKWWAVDSVTYSGMAILQRDGQSALVPEHMLEYPRAVDEKPCEKCGSIAFMVELDVIIFGEGTKVKEYLCTRCKLTGQFMTIQE